ncbi:MAG: o-succinylbenzoate--CoA ligase, partial [Akkermansiaceae bacterium]|nr:o-succinylbenzoate--CoA ligase [Akkermansiaceae bacterium]
VVFPTSGSGGEHKWVSLRREALLVSAEAVNRHLEVEPADVWMLALPHHHVGGFG